jgi:hypothetical protein
MHMEKNYHIRQFLRVYIPLYYLQRVTVLEASQIIVKTKLLMAHKLTIAADHGEDLPQATHVYVYLYVGDPWIRLQVGYGYVSGSR